MIRLFVSEPLAAGAEVILGLEQTHYLVNVMRQAAGAPAALFNGRDGEWKALIVEAKKKACRLVCAERLRAQETPPDLELVVAAVKRTRLETIVEKAAELGARRLPVGDAFYLADTDPKWGYQPDAKYDFKNKEQAALPDQTHSLHVGWRMAKGKDGKTALGMDGHHANMAGEYLGESFDIHGGGGVEIVQQRF